MSDTCGCKIYRGETIFRCSARGCAKARLCKGCVWMCADCGRDFCEQCIADLKDAEEPTRFSVYVCARCAARRKAGKVAA
jgi:hypothetical protein